MVEKWHFLTAGASAFLSILFLNLPKPDAHFRFKYKMDRKMLLFISPRCRLPAAVFIWKKAQPAATPGPAQIICDFIAAPVGGTHTGPQIICHEDMPLGKPKPLNFSAKM